MRDRLRRLAAWFGRRDLARLADPEPIPGERVQRPKDDLDALIEATREPPADFGRWEDSLKPYRHAYLTSCPDCFSDLEDEGANWWCQFCQRSWSFTSIVLLDEGTDPADD